MKFCLLNIAYDDSFHGFQKQPERRTVQGEILNALMPIGIDKVVVSSRTDSHVRSCSNIIELKTDDCLKVCRIVDSIEGIFVRGYVVSDEYVKLRGKVIKHKEIQDKVSLDIFTSYSTFTFIGMSFSWNFVRISVENIINRSRGKIDDEEWSELLQGKRKFRFKGKAENLILFRTELGLEMKEYQSRKLNFMKQKEILSLYWLKGIGVDIDSLLPHI
jgi:tRNA pseudouridine38-40 synthase